MMMQNLSKTDTIGRLMQIDDDCDMCELCGKHFELHSKDLNFDLFYQL